MAHGMKQEGREVAQARPRFGRFPLGLVPVLIVLGFLALVSSGPYFPFLPLVPLFFVFVFFVAPGIRRSAAGGVLDPRGVMGARPTQDGKEKELLRALERYEAITAARTALETSLSVAEAERMLTELASGGHVEVRSWDGTLAYALRAPDRSEAGPKELTPDANEGSLG
ncbi:MAG TPA: hypothetical protein VE219_04450 [Candidatus Sulfotelmatobacter sp.]|jgi:hypothetical protein|nr:hypothetical protein [Candidatus Sulfotelmatobacter sp.]